MLKEMVETKMAKNATGRKLTMNGRRQFGAALIKPTNGANGANGTNGANGANEKKMPAAASDDDDDGDFDVEDERKLANPPMPMAVAKKAGTGRNSFNDKDEMLKLIGAKQLLFMVGSSEQGKSYLMKYFLIEMCLRGDFKFGVIFTTTKHNSAFDFIKDQNCVISGYNEGALKRYLKELQGNTQPNFIVFEDCVGQMDVLSPFLSWFISSFRHFKCTVFIMTQYVKKISPIFREQVNRAFIFKQNTKVSYDALYESFGLGFDSFKDFKAQLDAITEENYRCMVYLKEKRGLHDDKYLSYKAPPEDQIPQVMLDMSPPVNDEE
jgi:hypothetical protein